MANDTCAGDAPPVEGGLLASLNLFGLSHLDPVILAALLDERPLLLIGAPGTAKSELLNRIATALGLEHRHYNASLIQIDDLLGFPIPNPARDAILYLHTPDDLWSAESVFLDEISRARPEVQNRIYSILHERRVQGRPLERLRYRWSAMNPPPSVEGTAEESPDFDPTAFAAHSVPLDPALADRFAWVVPLPPAVDLSPESRLRLVASGDEAPDSGELLCQALARAREEQARIPEPARCFAVRWAEALMVNLHQAGIWISGRRAVALSRSVTSLLAALAALNLEREPTQAAWLALHHGLPHATWGVRPPAEILDVLHCQAVRVAAEVLPGPLRSFARETDPIQRFALALEVPARFMEHQELSRILLTTWSRLPDVAARFAFSWAVAPLLAREDRFTAHACELVGAPLRKVLEFALSQQQTTRLSMAQDDLPERIDATVERLRKEGVGDPESLGNLLQVLVMETNEGFEPRTVVRQALEWRALFTQENRRLAA